MSDDAEQPFDADAMRRELKDKNPDMADATVEQFVEFQRMLTSGEKLHPELRLYLTEREGSFPVLQHPLVYAVPYTEMQNGMLNARFEAVKKELAKAQEEGKWGTYIWLHERAYRYDALQKIAAYIDFDATYWELVGQVWQDSENIWQNFEGWYHLWSEGRAGHEHSMEEEELEIYKALPDQFQVWRGVRHDDGIYGLSWTRDKDKAEWFARRVWGLGGSPIMVEGEVSKSDVLAYYTGRKESEVIVLPENVKNIDITYIEGEDIPPLLLETDEDE